VNAPGWVSLIYYLELTPKVNKLSHLKDFQTGDRLLIIAPHPDDEVLACAGAILSAIRAGASVFIVWVTSGDGFEWDEFLLSHDPLPEKRDMLLLGYRRMEECRQSASILGVPSDHLYFLGYPDGGIMRLLTRNYIEPFTSKYTGLNKVAYAESLGYGSPFTGHNLERDMERIIAKISPTVILAPSELDRHRDHRSVSVFVKRSARKLSPTTHLYFYIVHGGLEWPVPKGWHTNLPLAPPRRTTRRQWLRLDLLPEDIELKVQAIEAHKSQTKALGKFLAAFARTNELFSPEG